MTRRRGGEKLTELYPGVRRGVARNSHTAALNLELLNLELLHRTLRSHILQSQALHHAVIRDVLLYDLVDIA